MRPVVRIAVIGCALPLAGCSTVQTDSTSRRLSATLHDCSIDGVAGPARCGTVRVAESRESRDGRHIDLRIVVLPARTTTPAPDPVVPLVGGPGQGAADLAGPLSSRFDTLRDQRDLVFIDQRGTGQSNGLQCAPAAAVRDIMGRIFDSGRLAACRDELSARADLSQYTTTIAAGDYPLVFEALGYRQVNLVGTSYGSRMALEIARQFPDRLRTITIEGVVPQSFAWPTLGAPDANDALNALVDDCRADASCTQAFPTFRQDIDTAFAQLGREPGVVTVRDPATGAVADVLFGVTDLAYATRGLLYGNDALWLPLFFRQAAEGRYNAFAQAYVTRARSLDRQIARGVHLTVYCAEDLPFVDQAEAVRAAGGTYLGDYLLTQYRRACDIWPRAAIPPSYREAVTSRVPTLLMSGRRDPVTPPRTAAQAARTLSRARVLIWPYGGHGTDGLTTGDCRTTIVREFVTSAEPDHVPVECMTREPPLPFRR